MMRKPKVATKCVASHYARPSERIVEFFDGRSGGLISIRRDFKGRLLVEVYRADEDVVVRAENVVTGED
jgi:hypothetical protein